MAAPDILLYDIMQPQDIEVEVATSDYYDPLYDHDYISSKPRLESPKKTKRKTKVTNLTVIYKCKICGYSTLKREVMDKHRDIHKQIKPGTKYVPCNSCSVDNVPIGYEKCTECTYYAKNKRCLKLHMKIHQNGRPYKCTNCQFYGIDLKELINHYKTCKNGS